MSHAQQEATGHVPKPVEGITITVYDSEVLEPEPVRQGGLLRPDAVRIIQRDTQMVTQYLTETHIQETTQAA
jgi:pre-mRNA-splicing factor ATP-dependent RNA helicase DHX38/PRP16